MKKALALILTVAMAATAFCGCSSNTTASSGAASTGGDQGSSAAASSDPVDISFWYWEDYEGVHKDALEPLWKELGNNINVTFESVPQSSFHDKLITAASSGTAPDVFKLYPSWVSELSGMNALMDLTDITASWDVMSEIPESVMVTAYAGQDKLLTLPFCTVVMYLYCRADHFKEVGIDYPTTMDEFYAACEKLTRDSDGDGTVDTYGYSMRGARGGQDGWAALVLNAKPDWDYVDKDGNPTLLEPEIIEANDKFLNIYKNGWAPPTAPTDGFEQVVQNFKAGVASMLIHHVGSSTGMVEDVGDENVAVVQVPAAADGTRYVAGLPSSIAVYSETPNKDAAVELAKWITSPDIHEAISDAVDMVPWMNSVESLEKYQEDRFMKISIESLPSSKMNPVVPAMGQFVEQYWPQAMQRALMGEISSEEMLQEMSDSLKG